MLLDTAIHKGVKDKPAVILIHGLGIDKNIWVDTINTRIFAKNIPVRVFTTTKPKSCISVRKEKITLGVFPKNIKSLWTALKDEGFNLICWSQSRPVGPINIAVKELVEVVRKTKRIFPKTPVALIGHSRGGLIARKFMEKERQGVKALITISTPHSGSSIARFGKYLKPFSVVLKGVLPGSTHNTISEIIKNISALLEGNTLKELLPDSAFFKTLKDSPQKGVNYMSLGGTEPRLFTIYRWEKIDRKMYPRPLLSIPDSLLKIFPSFLVADEITPGKGDGLVTADSSLLPWASRHQNLPVNHLSILWNKSAIKSIIEKLRTI